MLNDKHIRSMGVDTLRSAVREREAVIRTAHRELQQLKRELERRTPRVVHFRVLEDSFCFEYVDTPCRRYPEGQRHRVHPRKASGATRYPVDLCADEIEAWMRREGITHVFSESNVRTTTPESLKRGRHTRAQFIAWWRLLEEKD